MSAEAKPKLVHAEELLGAEYRDRHVELYAGCVREAPPSGDEHGLVSACVAEVLGTWRRSLPSERRTRLGPRGAETGFLLEQSPDTVLAPDYALVDLWKSYGNAHPYRRGAPYLAVEVKSPSNSLRALRERAALYLAHGGAEVWIANSEDASLEVHRGDALPVVLQRDSEYIGADLLDGLRFRVRELFE